MPVSPVTQRPSQGSTPRTSATTATSTSSEPCPISVAPQNTVTWQGSDDVLVAVVAEVLGVDPFDVRCVTGDTGITPVDLGSYSSRVTVMMGNAAIQASQKLKDLIAAAAAEQLDVAPDRLTFADGKVFFENRSLSFAEAVGFAEEKFGTLGAVGSYKPPRSPGRYN